MLINGVDSEEFARRDTTLFFLMKYTLRDVNNWSNLSLRLCIVRSFIYSLNDVY